MKLILILFTLLLFISVVNAEVIKTTLQIEGPTNLPPVSILATPEGPSIFLNDKECYNNICVVIENDTIYVNW